MNLRAINLATIGIIILCALINIAGLVGTSWMVNGKIHEGLWKHYDDGDKTTQDIDGRGKRIQLNFFLAAGESSLKSNAFLDKSIFCTKGRSIDRLNVLYLAKTYGCVF